MDPDGNVHTSSDPTGGASTWAKVHVAPYQVNGLTCPIASLCVAEGAISGPSGGHEVGDIITSANPTGGASTWSVAHLTVGYAALAGAAFVSCPSTSLCVAAVGGYVATSTDPTGGASTWTTTEVGDGGTLAAISCPTTALCVAVGEEGDVITSTDP